MIYVFKPDGNLVAKWQPTKVSNGLDADGQGNLYVLHERNITVHKTPDGTVIRQIDLPTVKEGLAAPYGAVLVRSNGEILVTDLNKDQVLRFGADGRALSPLGVHGDWPGQFAGPGGMPGEFAGVGALAQDAAGRIYVSDSLYRLVERFAPQGEIDAIITVPEQVANEKPLTRLSR
jgi:hypothetical protein